MNWKKTFSAYFTFSRKDRTGILALICIIFLALLIPRYFTKPRSSPLITEDSTLLNISQNRQENNPDEGKFHVEHSEKQNYHFSSSKLKDYNENAPIFHFDPNTLDEDGWKKLGLNARTTHTIINYRQKGGRFYQPKDLKKIWGMPDGFYQRVKAHIKISSIFQPSYSNYSNNKKADYINIIDINKADTSAFIELPGIGSRLANRIVNFREKLGGFCSIEQIKETYGLPDSTFQKVRNRLKVELKEVKKININLATKEELMAHPYIKWNLANIIVEFRNQHGSFHSIEDLKQIMLIDESTFEKIAPYLTVN